VHSICNKPNCHFFIEKIKIVCYLHHDELKAVFHVSTRIRKAVSIIFILMHPLLVQFKWFYRTLALLVPLAISWSLKSWIRWFLVLRSALTGYILLFALDSTHVTWITATYHALTQQKVVWSSTAYIHKRLWITIVPNLVLPPTHNTCR
jgi:hypothetical protein